MAMCPRTVRFSIVHNIYIDEAMHHKKKWQNYSKYQYVRRIFSKFPFSCLGLGDLREMRKRDPGPQ